MLCVRKIVLERRKGGAKLVTDVHARAGCRLLGRFLRHRKAVTMKAARRRPMAT